MVTIDFVVVEGDDKRVSIDGDERGLQNLRSEIVSVKNFEEWKTSQKSVCIIVCKSPLKFTTNPSARLHLLPLPNPFT